MPTLVFIEEDPMTHVALAHPVAAPPGPREYPLIGNLDSPRAVRNLLHHCERMWRRHGDVVRLNLFGRRMTLLCHPDHLMRVLLTERASFVKGPTYDGARTLMGNSLVTLEGSAWRERRSLAQPAFHRQSLARLTQLMVSSGARYCDELDRRMVDGELLVDAHTEMTRLTLDVVVTALFGRDIIDLDSDVEFSALGRALELISSAFNGLPLPRWIPTPYNLRFKRTLATLDQTVYKIIAAGKAREAGDGTLLSMLLAAKDEQGRGLPLEALRDEVFTLFLAGHETTALTMTWLIAMLDGRDPVLGRMVEEVDGVLGGREPSFEDVPKLPYVRQVIDETLRFRPPAAMIGRDVLTSTEFNGFTVPAGESVTPFIWAVHRHPDYWPDPERFDPERFTPERVKKRSNWAYLPFSGGPRTCIGNTFSLTEATVLVAQLLTRFQLRVLPCADAEPVAIGTVRPSRPVRVALRRRARPSPRTVGPEVKA
jgi:cytochrome P450